MRVAGIDFGRARIGVAVSDDLGSMAHPRPALAARSLTKVIERLGQLAEAEQLQLFVVGLPRQLDGREGVAARRVRRFAELLERATHVPVELIDEWLTTREAQARLHAQGLDSRESRERIDSAAAAILLQSWLDGNRLSHHGPEEGELRE